MMMQCTNAVSGREALLASVPNPLRHRRGLQPLGLFAGARSTAHAMQVAKNLSVRLHPAGFVVRQPAGFAERLYQASRLPQTIARQCGEKMVLNLVVKTAAEEVGESVW